MSKVVLVMDMPNTCIDCPCHFADDSGMVRCGKEDKELLTDDIEAFKPNWCPLRDMPEKKKLTYKDLFEDNRVSGYNSCIDEILNGGNEECREARERQRGKKPEFYGDFEDGKLLCPNCGEDLMDLAECGFNHCPYCGQAIDWSDTD